MGYSWGLWITRKRILFLTFLIIAFLCIPTTTFVPVSRASEIQGKIGLSSVPLELLGKWPYGACVASAVDAARKIAFIGNGNMMQVLDFSAPSGINKIGEVNLGRSVQDITISGNYAYVITYSSLKIVDISDLNNPHEVSSVYYLYSQILKFRSMALSSGNVYIAAKYGMLIYDVSDPYNPVFQAWYHDDKTEIQNVAVWGNYAIYGGDGEVRVIDISNPAAPSLAGTCQTDAGYKIQGLDVSSNGYICVCLYNESINTSKIAIIDLATSPNFPVEVGSYIGTGLNFEGVKISGKYAFFYDLYLCLFIIDISTPSAPKWVGEWKNNRFCDLDVSGNIVGISRGKGFSLCNVSAPDSPSSLGYFDTPDIRYGWSNSVVASGDYVYMSSSDEGLRIMDVSDPSHPREAGLCSGFFANGGIAISGKFAFCVGGRLGIVDISSPFHPYLAATLDLSRIDPPCDRHDIIDIAIRGSYAYVAGTKWISNNEFATLVIVDISNPLNPSIIGTYVCPVKSLSFGGIALSGNYAYLAVREDGACLRVIDISNPAHPTEVSHFMSDPGEFFALALVVRENYAFLAGQWLTIIDISNPESLREINSIYLNFTDPETQIVLSGDHAYVGNLRIFDISDPKHTYEVLRYWGEAANGTAVSGNYVYLPGSLSILKNLLAPEVSITAPSAQSFLSGSASIEVRASHDSGINRVEFYVDNELISTDYASKYTYIWDTDSAENGPHKIRARAYNNEGKSSDYEIGVTVRNYDPPLKFSGQKVMNRSLSQSEYINVLTWQSNPNNTNIVKYRIYEREGKNLSLLVELDASTFIYLHRGVEKDKQYTYALVAVDEDKIESKTAITSVQ